MLTQQELIEGLKSLGENVTSQTLRNREKQGLITPSYKGIGNRPGRSVFYPDRCLWENYAASKMLTSQRLRLTAKEVCAARELALQLEVMNKDEFKKIVRLPEHESLPLRFAEYWHAYFLHAKNGAPMEWAVSVSFVTDHHSQYDDLEIIHSYGAVTKDITTGEVQCQHGDNIFIDIEDGRTWENGYIDINTSRENLVYIEVEGIGF